jgi:hypothetical protein
MSGRNPKTKPVDYKLFVRLGIGEIAWGLVLIALALSGVLDVGDPTFLVVVGGVIALVGVGMVIWARSKMDGGAR